MSRLIGIVLGAGAGSLLYKLTGGSLVQGWGFATLLSVAAFTLMTLAEYEREKDE
jgi:predicted MFS family arabinose efflux permease